MKINKHNIYLVGGVGMLVGAFFAAAKALGGLISLIYIFFATDFSNAEPTFGENLTHSLMSAQISGAIQGVASALILFFGARWLISRPLIIDRWILRGDQKPCQTKKEGEQVGDGDAEEAV